MSAQHEEKPFPRTYPVKVTTTFGHDVEVGEAEYLDLRRQGVIDFRTKAEQKAEESK